MSLYPVWNPSATHVKTVSTWAWWRVIFMQRGRRRDLGLCKCLSSPPSSCWWEYKEKRGRCRRRILNLWLTAAPLQHSHIDSLRPLLSLPPGCVSIARLWQGQWTSLFIFLFFFCSILFFLTWGQCCGKCIAIASYAYLLLKCLVLAWIVIPHAAFLNPLSLSLPFVLWNA